MIVMARLYIPVFSLTLLLSALLLFAVQPMFSRMILPLLGGTPQVWNTAMLFFQLCLLAGYGYAHGTSRFLSPRVQAGVQLVLLGAFFFVLPFGIPPGSHPPRDADPTLWQLSLMAASVGGPFFTLAASAPMLQRWFARSTHAQADNPYFLYGASNLGSMAALLAYPVLIEPLAGLDMQARLWMFGYAGLIAMTLIAAVLSRSATIRYVSSTHTRLGWGQRASWLLLSFIPSSLMLGVTTFITTDIATVPLLWILPLALYVGTFILVFARKPILSEQIITTLFGLSLIVLVGLKVAFNYTPLNPFLLIGVHLSVFFFAALCCHTALVRAKPSADHLTEFYLFMSLGGALGGFFNAIIAPLFLIIPIEYGLLLGLAAFMRFYHDRYQSLGAVLGTLRLRLSASGLNALFIPPVFYCALIGVLALFNFSMSHKFLSYSSAITLGLCLVMLLKSRWLFGMMIVLLLALFPLGFYWGQNAYRAIIYQDRNFFGVLKVVDDQDNLRVLLHGTTNHGTQSLDEAARLQPLSYYSFHGPLNDAVSLFDRSGKQQAAVIGLGVGVTNCYARAGRHFDFYEIDPAIAAIAVNAELFTFMRDCGDDHDIILGDGRLTIAEKPDAFYDFIILDAFSSDNIPIHVMTVEAFDLYFRKLKDGGAIIMNISNNYLDLEPVVGANAKALGVRALGKIDLGGTLPGTTVPYYPSHWMVLTKSDQVVSALEKKSWSAALFADEAKPWSDQYSNIISALGKRASETRYRALEEKP